jgi:general secretion pathway protein G
MYCAWCGTQVPTVSYTLCSNCGKPTNGATGIPAGRPSGGTNTAAILIAVVVGFFVIVAFIGILAAIAIPNLLTAMQRSKQKRTVADIRTIATCVEAYSADKNAYPSVNSVEELRPLLVPTYVKTLPAIDGWGAAFRYECAETKDGVCSRYVVGSGGKDLRFERGALRDYIGEAPLATTNFDCDVVYSNGEFVEYPEGVQR